MGSYMTWSAYVRGRDFFMKTSWFQKTKRLLAVLAAAGILASAVPAHAAAAISKIEFAHQEPVVLKASQYCGEGTYHIHSCLNTGQVADACGAGTANGTIIQLYGKKPEMQGSENQKFEFIYLSSGWYVIREVNSGKVLDVRGGSSASGTPVQLYSYNNTKAQHWALYSAGGAYYYIRNELGCYLDARGGASKNGTPLQVYRFNGSNAQKWGFTHALKKSAEVKVSSAIFHLHSVLSYSQVIDVDGFGTANGTKIHLWKYYDNENQKFTLNRFSDGWYEIIDANSGKALDVQGGKAGSGVIVQLYGRNGTKAQRWKFYSAGNGYYYILNELGYFLDARGGAYANGTQIQVYEFNATAAQKWALSGAVKRQKQTGGTTGGGSTKSGTDRMVSNLNNDASLGLKGNKKTSVVVMARTLLNAGYEPAFAAGVLANIIKEGAVGQFESSAYKKNEPSYLVYMDKNFSYRSKYSGKNITSVSLNDLYQMLLKLQKGGWKGKFGLGCVQWTGGRTKTLVEQYRAIANGSDRITLSQASEGECRMILKELAGSYKWVYTGWKSAGGSKTTADAAYNAASRFCLYYEVPSNKSAKARERGNLAKSVYKVMMK